MDNAVFFHPWVGRNYQNGGIFGKKILILGESHYCDGQCEGCGTEQQSQCYGFTTDVLNDYLNPKQERKTWMTTFVKFERSLVNHITDWDERRDIWDSVAFYNYLQIPLEQSRQAGTDEQYSMAKGPFFTVLSELQPDLLIVWGIRLWDRTPCENWVEGDEIIVDGRRVLNGSYLIGDNKSVRTVCVYHPSAGYSWDYWYKVIQSVM